MAVQPALAQGWPSFDADEPFTEPPSLPESINGVIRSSERAGRAGHLNRIRDVFGLLRSCWHPPGASATGQEVTIRLSFKRSGEVLGAPRITYIKAAGSRQDREAFTRSVLAAFQGCTPLRFSPSFGAAITGRPFTFRFVDDRAI